jgi:hypothetical protein
MNAAPTAFLIGCPFKRLWARATERDQQRNRIRRFYSRSQKPIGVHNTVPDENTRGKGRFQRAVISRLERLADLVWLPY